MHYKTAWLDESFEEHDRDGFHMSAASAFVPGSEEQSSQELRSLTGSRQIRKPHWSRMDHKERLAAATLVARLPAWHVVAVETPVPRRKQERARSKCLATLIHELHPFDITHLVIEAREPTLNRRDIQTAINARHGLPLGAQCRIQHAAGATEPLLWAADIVVGAARCHRLGEPEYLALIQEVYWT